MKITNVRRDGRGNITDVKFDNGSQMTIIEAIDLAKAGEIDDVRVGMTRNGHETLRAAANDTPEDNLDNLPGF